NVLTGFKFIGEQITFLEKKGEENRYIFGFEESYGYLAGTYARDKDAVVASMLICEMTAYYKSKGMSLLDALNAIYSEYGYYLHKQESFTFEGESGMQKMNEIMDNLRNNLPKQIGGFKVTVAADYLQQISKNIAEGKEEKIDLPKSNVLSYSLENGSQVVLRPSGTEPKIKAYYSSCEPTKAECEAVLEILKQDFKLILGV
ncbi:MAG: phospho-sugar mutase, partial [Oscillospiraceae bacterium]